MSTAFNRKQFTTEIHSAVEAMFTGSGQCTRQILIGAMAPAKDRDFAFVTVLDTLADYGFTGGSYTSNVKRIFAAAETAVQGVFDLYETSGQWPHIVNLIKENRDAFPTIGKGGRPKGKGAGKTPKDKNAAPAPTFSVPMPDDLKHIRMLIQGLVASANKMPMQDAAHIARFVDGANIMLASLPPPAK